MKSRTLIISNGDAKGNPSFQFTPKQFKIPQNFIENRAKSAKTGATLKRQRATTKLIPYITGLSETPEAANQRIDNGLQINDRIVSKINSLYQTTDSAARNPDEDRINIIKQMYSKIQFGSISNQTSVFNYEKTAQIEALRRYKEMKQQVENTIRSKSQRVREGNTGNYFIPRNTFVTQGLYQYNINDVKQRSRSIISGKTSAQTILELNFQNNTTFRPVKKLKSSIENKRYELNFMQQEYKKYYSNDSFKAKIQSIDQSKKDKTGEAFKFKSTFNRIQSATSILSKDSTFLTHQNQYIDLQNIYNDKQKE